MSASGHCGQVVASGTLVALFRVSGGVVLLAISNFGSVYSCTGVLILQIVAIGTLVALVVPVWVSVLIEAINRAVGDDGFWELNTVVLFGGGILGQVVPSNTGCTVIKGGVSNTVVHI